MKISTKIKIFIALGVACLFMLISGHYVQKALAAVAVRGGADFLPSYSKNMAYWDGSHYRKYHGDISSNDIDSHSSDGKLCPLDFTPKIMNSNCRDNYVRITCFKSADGRGKYALPVMPGGSSANDPFRVVDPNQTKNAADTPVVSDSQPTAPSPTPLTPAQSSQVQTATQSVRQVIVNSQGGDTLTISGSNTVLSDSNGNVRAIFGPQIVPVLH